MDKEEPKMHLSLFQLGVESTLAAFTKRLSALDHYNYISMTHADIKHTAAMDRRLYRGMKNYFRLLLLSFFRSFFFF